MMRQTGHAGQGPANAGPGQRRFGCACLLLGCALPVVAGVSALQHEKAVRREQGERWIAITGRILRVRIEARDRDLVGSIGTGYLPVVEFHYRVADQDYASSRLNDKDPELFPSLAEAEARIRAYCAEMKPRQIHAKSRTAMALSGISVYPPGREPVAVYYDRQDPRKAVLELRPVPPSDALIWIGRGLIALGLILFVLALFRGRARS